MYCFLAIFLLSIFLSYRLKAKLVVTVPMVFSWFVVAAFFLAMPQKLNVMDYISYVIIAIVFISFFVRSKHIDFRAIRDIIIDGSFLGLFFGILFVAFMARFRVPARWDDLVCWALETKTIYLCNGFAAPGMTSSIGYAAYRPGVMIVIWFFCHLVPNAFHDQLIYMGFYSAYLIFTAPLFLIIRFKKFKAVKSIIAGIGFAVLLSIIPSIVCSFEYYAVTSELLQSAVIAVMLILIFSTFKKQIKRKEANLLFLSYTMFLSILKDTSIIFIFLILLLSIIIFLFQKKEYCISIVTSLCSLAPFFLLTLSWNIFCKYASRVTNNNFTFDSYMKNASAYFSGHPASEDAAEYMAAVKKAFLSCSLNGNTGFGIKLGFPALVIIIIISLFLFYKFNIYQWSKKEIIFIEIFTFAAIVLYSISVFGMYVFCFEEPQYKDASHIMISFSRYIEPMLLSMTLFIIGSLFQRMRKVYVYCAVIILVMICADYPAYYEGLAYGITKPDIKLDNWYTLQRKDMIATDSNLVYGIYDKRIDTSSMNINVVTSSYNDNFLCNMRYIMAPIPFYVSGYSADTDINNYFVNGNTYIYFEDDESASNYGLKPKVLYNKKDLGLE